MYWVSRSIRVFRKLFSRTTEVTHKLKWCNGKQGAALLCQKIIHHICNAIPETMADRPHMIKTSYKRIPNIVRQCLHNFEGLLECIQQAIDVGRVILAKVCDEG